MTSDDSNQYPRFQKEDELMIEAIDHALAFEPGAFSAGYNGEIPLCDFFSRFLPPVVTVTMGRIGFPNCEVSPPIGVLILDSRYPLLSYYPDGLVLAPLHAVLATFTVTTALTATNILEMQNNIAYAASLSDSLMAEDGTIKSNGFAYRSNVCLSELKAILLRKEDKQRNHDMYVLRLSKEDYVNMSTKGFARGNPSDSPLYSMYSDLIQNIFSLLNIRNYDQDGLTGRLAAYKDWPSISNENHADNVTPSARPVEEDGFVF
jgi:hypothetical protein